MYYDFTQISKDNLLTGENGISHPIITTENGINNLLFDAGVFLKLLLDDKKKKNITYYLTNEYDMNMFDNKSYVNDKKENTSFKNYVDNVTNKVSIKALDWFKKHFSKALNKISSVNISDESKNKFRNENNRLLSLLCKDTENMNLQYFKEYGFDIKDEDNTESNINYLRSKINEMLKNIANGLIDICLADVSSKKTPIVNLQTQQNISYPYPIAPINIQNSEYIQMAPFIVPTVYTPSYNDKDINKHFVITDCVKVNNANEEADFKALLKTISLVLDSKDAQLKLKHPSKFAFTFFIDTNCWKCEKLNKNNVPYDVNDKNYQCIYRNGSEPLWHGPAVSK